MIEHEQYYRKGGTYELPVEIYNDLIGQIEDAQKERNDYKSRCEKAMELLKLPIVYETHQENGERDELLKKIRQAKDILNGSEGNE